jgi:hypothetical protein
MELHTSRRPLERESTPNCVDCSRGLEHAVCRTLHLLGTDWLIEQTPHRDEVPQARAMRPPWLPDGHERS